MIVFFSGGKMVPLLSAFSASNTKSFPFKELNGATMEQKHSFLIKMTLDMLSSFLKDWKSQVFFDFHFLKHHVILSLLSVHNLFLLTMFIFGTQMKIIVNLQTY